MTKKDIWPLLKQSASEWTDDHVPRLSAALAYYTMLSIAPLLVITVKIVGMWYRNSQQAQTHVMGYLQNFIGSQSAQALQSMTTKATQPGSGVMATIISFVILFVSAGGVFGELQDSMNVVFNVQPRPNQGWMAIVKQRFLSLTLVLGSAFLLLVSLIVTTVLSTIVHSIGMGWLWTVVNIVVSLVVVAGLFALIFKYLPDVKVPWKPVCFGAGLTAILFTLGKFALSWYLGRGSTTSVYGAAGSLAALLIWTYYSGCILFFGAEFTQALAKLEGHAIQPAPNAIPMSDASRMSRGAPKRASVAHAAAEYRPMPSDLAAFPSRRPAGRRAPTPYAVAGLAVGAMLGGVGYWLTERGAGKCTTMRSGDELDQRIRDLEHRVNERMREQRLFRARAIDDYVADYKQAHSTHVAEAIKHFANKVVQAVKHRAV